MPGPALPLPEVAGVVHRTLDVAGLPVHVAEAGDPGAAPLVLLHGWPQHWWCWRRVVPLLAPSYRLVVPDLRGHGWTGAPPSGYAKEQLASDLLGLLDALGLPRVGLVGHDWGGWVGFLACLRAPERFTGLLALGVPHPFQRPDPRVLPQLWRGTYAGIVSTPVLGEAVLRGLPRVVEQLLQAGTARPGTFTAGDLRVYSAVLADPARARASSRLYRTFLLREAAAVARGRYRAADLRVPARLMVGADDPVVRPVLLRGWEQVPRGSGPELLPGVGHFVPEEVPEVVAERVRDLFPAGRSSTSGP